MESRPTSAQNSKNSGRMSNDARNFKREHATKECSSQEGKAEGIHPGDGGGDRGGTEQEQEAERMLPVCTEGFHNYFRTDRFFLEYISNASRTGHSLHLGALEVLILNIPKTIFDHTV